MKRYLHKEWRIIAPVAAAIVCMHLLAYTELLLFEDLDTRAFIITVQWVLFHILAVLPFGMEFQSGAMERLLSQPMSRKRIWWKTVTPMLVFFVFSILFNVLLSFIVLVFAGARIEYELFVYLPRVNVFYMAAAIIASCGGLFTSIYARRLLIALVAALLLPILVYTLLVASYLVSSYYGWRTDMVPFTQKTVFTFLVVLVMIYAAAAYTLAYRRFMRLEV